jgi:hypothetical protein
MQTKNAEQTSAAPAANLEQHVEQLRSVVRTAKRGQLTSGETQIIRQCLSATQETLAKVVRSAAADQLSPTLLRCSLGELQMELSHLERSLSGQREGRTEA